MSDIKEKIRKLITKAKESGDTDLLDLAMDLMDQIPANEEPVEVKSRHPNGYEEFAMNQVNSKQPKPVQVKKRENKFKDTGEHKDIETPTVQLTERRRPAFKKVDQTCSRCSRSVEVHPQHVREFYVCDRCLRR